MPMQPFERKVVRFWITHIAVGVGVAALATFALLYWNMGGLGTLIGNAKHPWAWALFLFGSLSLSFAPLSLFIGVMAQQEDDDP